MGSDPRPVDPTPDPYRSVSIRNVRDIPSDPSPRAQSAGGASAIRFLLPQPRSPGHGLVVLLVGFAVEGGTELYQFLARGDLVQGPILYYATLATTILGFYLMFLGLREWHTFHPKMDPRELAGARRSWPWFGVALWVGGTGATAALSLVWGAGGAGSSPIWIAWPVGGIVVLAFGSFFFGLRKEAQRFETPAGNALGWVSFVWSLGVATVAGWVVGGLAVRLLIEFVTNWVALIGSVGPIVVAMSPLFVTYVLMISAFWPALRNSRDGIL
jgi:hypothetical protein